jgi:hypothetical protein
MNASLGFLAAAQDKDGAFESTIVEGACAVPDRNGFVAALILRTLRRVPGDADLDEVRGHALDFIAGCASREFPGAFGFWPPGERPSWARGVPADVDDTAVMALELHRHGRLDRVGVLRSLAAIMHCRVGDSNAAMRPPWIATGSFHTWFGAGPGREVVDCCVNANVAALMERLGGCGLPGYHEAIRTVVDGLAWAGHDAVRLDALTPFYPSPHALLEAVSHAVECGARELEPAAALLRALVAEASNEDEGCCRSAYGRTTWHCAALQVARELAARTPHDEGRLTCRS